MDIYPISQKLWQEESFYLENIYSRYNTLLYNNKNKEKNCITYTFTYNLYSLQSIYLTYTSQVNNIC